LDSHRSRQPFDLCHELRMEVGEPARRTIMLYRALCAIGHDPELSGTLASRFCSIFSELV
jgi:hypothetical protein